MASEQKTTCIVYERQEMSQRKIHRYRKFIDLNEMSDEESEQTTANGREGKKREK